MEATLRPEAEVTSLAYLVLWWDNKRLHSGLYADARLATYVAEAHNGVLISLALTDLSDMKIDDYYWRDEKGQPMPTVWRTMNVIPKPL